MGGVYGETKGRGIGLRERGSVKKGGKGIDIVKGGGTR